MISGQIMLVCTACVISASFIAGWVAKGHAIKAGQLDEVQAQVHFNEKAASDQDQSDQALVLEGAEDDRMADATFHTLKLEIPHVELPPPAIIELPPACPRPPACISDRFVGVWNAALAATVPASTTRLADPAEKPGAASSASKLAGAGTRVTPREILSNHIDNAQIHAHNRNQCEQLIRWHQAQNP